MAVDPNIKKKADDIRNKVYGKEVRESLASGLEEMSSDVVENEGRQSVVEGRQDSVESQWQAVSDEMTDKDVISAPEIIAARDGEPNLKAKIDKNYNEVTAQLAQTASYLDDKKIDRGNVLLNDLNKNSVKFDGTWFTSQFLDDLSKGVLDVTNVLDDSLTTSKFVDKSVTVEKVDFAKRNKNLFSGRFMDGIGIGGDDIRGYKIHDLEDKCLAVIPIKPEKNYTVSIKTSADYKLTRVGFISEKPKNNLDVDNVKYFSEVKSVSLKSEKNHVYLVVGLTDKTKKPEILQVEEGKEFTGFEDYNTISLKTGISEIKPDETTFVEYDKTELGNYGNIDISGKYNEENDGKALTSGGVLVSNKFTDGLTVTDKIGVMPEMVYKIKCRNVVFYDETNKVVGFFDNVGHKELDFETPKLTTNARLTMNSLEKPSTLIKRLPNKEKLPLLIPRLKTKEKRFRGKTIAHFGDSITANSPLIPETIKERLDNDYINLAIGGTKMANRIDLPELPGGGHTANSGFRIAKAIADNDFSDQIEYYTEQDLDWLAPIIARLAETDYTKVDYATVMFGTNDHLQEIPIGTLEDETGDTFIGAYKLFIEELLGAYPNIKLLICSMPYNYRELNDRQNQIIEYVEATELVAKHYNLPYLNTFSQGGINSLNKYQFFDEKDSVHPNDKGLLHLGNMMANSINTFY